MEILIKALDASHPDSGEDERGCFKRGDPVAFMPDGHEWGRCEGAPTFWRVRITGAPAAVVQRFCEPHWNGIWTMRDEMPQQAVRRRWRFSPELLAPELREALLRGEIVPVDWQTWLHCVHDKSQQRGRGLNLGSI